MIRATRSARTLALGGGRVLDLGRTSVMGIVNVTDDSFYERSRARGVDDALARVDSMVADGADIVDIGAESTRPGAFGVSLDDELAAVVPVVEAVRAKYPMLPVSVDTRKAAVAEASISAGADIINDVSGLLLDDERDAMMSVAARTGAPYVLMHTRGTPSEMNALSEYDDLWRELTVFFARGIDMLNRAGVSRSRVILDPGLGFAKEVDANCEITANIAELKALGCPLLIGASRKRFLGAVMTSDETSAQADERLEATLAVTALCAAEGVEIVRVHDVAPNVRVANTIMNIMRYRHAK